MIWTPINQEITGGFGGSSGPVLLQQEMEMAEKAQRGYQTMGHLE